MTTARDSTMTLDTSRILALAAEIRRVDGGNKSGAAELAERLMPFIDNHLTTRGAVLSDEASGFEYRHLSLPNADGEREWLPWQRFGTDMQIRKRAALESLASRKVAVPDAKLTGEQVAEILSLACEEMDVINGRLKAMLASQDEVK